MIDEDSSWVELDSLCSYWGLGARYTTLLESDHEQEKTEAEEEQEEQRE